MISHVNRISGEDNFNLESYFPSSLPIHSFVDLKIKQLVWTNQYVDFTQLLPRDERPKNADQWIIQITKDSIDTKTSHDNLISYYPLWDKAFHIFLSIHAANPSGLEPKHAIN